MAIILIPWNVFNPSIVLNLWSTVCLPHAAKMIRYWCLQYGSRDGKPYFFQTFTLQNRMKKTPNYAVSQLNIADHKVYASEHQDQFEEGAVIALGRIACIIAWPIAACLTILPLVTNSFFSSEGSEFGIYSELCSISAVDG